MLHLTVRPGSEKERIWKICDEFYQRDGRIPAGIEVVETYVGQGGNRATGFTQYSNWKKRVVLKTAMSAIDPADETESMSVGLRPANLGDDGHLVLPPEIRRAMMLDADGRVTLEVTDGELRVISPMAAIRQLQRRATGLVPPGTRVSDELIAERREEAANG